MAFFIRVHRSCASAVPGISPAHSLLVVSVLVERCGVGIEVTALTQTSAVHNKVMIDS